MFLLAAVVALAVSPADAAPRSKRKPVGPVKDRYAAIVMDARTGEVLHEVNADAPRHPASITKIMTLYLTFEALERGRLQLDQQLPVSAYAATVPWGLPLRPGMTISVEEAILGLITKSANNAATVIAESMAGTEAAFAQHMTLRARRLGMHGTTFRNASGLPDPRQITTARDFTVLARALLRDYPKYYPYFATRGFTFRGNWYHNHNRLLDQFDGLDGIKTGFVNAS
ncbi:MAG: D-alanyl-D-alanine carboxypeptidase family protein, partial [Alphaproteobacteria bacterium]